MEDKAIRVTAGLHLGVLLCTPNYCSNIGAEVNARDTHGLSCHFSKSRHCCHAAVNNNIKRVLGAAKIPSHFEHSDLSQSDGTQPDGATTIPWKSGKTLVWDATCLNSLAPSYTNLAATEAGAVTEEAERKKD